MEQRLLPTVSWRALRELLYLDEQESNSPFLSRIKGSSSLLELEECAAAVLFVYFALVFRTCSQD